MNGLPLPRPLLWSWIMGKHKDTGRIDLHQVFLHVREQMLAELSSSHVFEHPTAAEPPPSGIGSASSTATSS